MISSVKLTASPFTSSDFSNRKLPLPKLPFLSLPTTQNAKQSLKNSLFSQKPIYISSIENFALPTKTQKRGTECKAYEADRSRPLEINIELSDDPARVEAAQRLKIGIYFATWWALNVVFNIYNKKVLNAFPYPWLTSTLSLAAGSLMMLISWATRITDAPNTDLEFWKTLFPVRKLVTFESVKGYVGKRKISEIN
jgi:solute carrier family 35 protein E1